MGLMTVHEVCQKTGVTRRTLQHYDALGLLPPTGRTEGGIRQYDEQAVKTLLEILTYKEFGFPLEEIKELLQDPSFDRKAALEGRIQALQQAGDLPYSEFLSKLRGEWNMNQLSEHFRPLMEERPELNDALIRLYDDLCGMCGSGPESAAVQAKVGELRGFIQENLYQSPLMGFRMLGTALLSGGEYSLGMKQIYGEEAIRFAAAAIQNYCDRAERMQAEPRKPGAEWNQLLEAAAKRNREGN